MYIALAFVYQYFCTAKMDANPAAAIPIPTIKYNAPSIPPVVVMKKPITTGDNADRPVDSPFIVPAAIESDFPGTSPWVRQNILCKSE